MLQEWRRIKVENELIYLFEVEEYLCARFEVDELGEDFLSGTAHGERFDAERHPIARPMKAVTHHGAELKDTETGVRGRIIFDSGLRDIATSMNSRSRKGTRASMPQAAMLLFALVQSKR